MFPFNIIEKITDPIFKTIDKSSDNAVKKEELKAQLKQQLTSAMSEAMKYQSEVLKTEMTGSWMQRNWRPCLMFLFMAILADVFIIGPKIQMFYPAYKVSAIPTQMWGMLTVAIGGYGIGRSFEKIKGAKND